MIKNGLATVLKLKFSSVVGTKRSGILVIRASLNVIQLFIQIVLGRNSLIFFQDVAVNWFHRVNFHQLWIYFDYKLRWFPKRRLGVNSIPWFAVRFRLIPVNSLYLFESIFSAHFLTASFGAMNGWAAVNFVNLQKDDTTFPSGPLTLRQATFMMSIAFIPSIIGNMVFPYIVKLIGCKRTIYVMGFPQIVCLIRAELRKKNRFEWFRNHFLIFRWCGWW